MVIVDGAVRIGNILDSDDAAARACAYLRPRFGSRLASGRSHQVAPSMSANFKLLIIVPSQIIQSMRCTPCSAAVARALTKR
jgi:hypothetical protein